MPILYVAHEYEVPSLVELIEARISGRLDDTNEFPAYVEQVAAIYTRSGGKHCQFVAKKCLERPGLLDDVEFDELRSKHPELAMGLLRAAIDQDPEMAVELIKKAVDTKPMLASSLMKEAVEQQPELAESLLSDVVAFRHKAAKKKRKRERNA